ncbi:MAG: tripartite tricarboxylate transporter substrate binding protein, partial [Burkholderiales bacterium]|nr:tripartite tricarboxylate transporter substrate binding protein [Burkholderiales bacterium]
DVLTRRIGDKLAQRWCQPVVIDNRAGGNTLIGSQYAARASADGYTLYSTNTTLLQLPLLTPNARYDALRDFVPVVQYAAAPLALAVPATNPSRNLKELVAWLKARPGKTSYGTSGAGGSQHIFSEALKRATGFDSVHVPYKGEAPMLNDFLAGRLDWYIATPISILPHVRAGKVRLLAVTGDQRLPLAPEVPTFKEEGIADLVVVGWYGLFAPAGTPKPIVAKLGRELSAIVRSPEVAAGLREGGLVVSGLSGDEFGALLPGFRDAFERMIRENDIRVE